MELDSRRPKKAISGKEGGRIAIQDGLVFDEGSRQLIGPAPKGDLGKMSVVDIRQKAASGLKSLPKSGGKVIVKEVAAKTTTVPAHEELIEIIDAPASSKEKKKEKISFADSDESD